MLKSLVLVASLQGSVVSDILLNHGAPLDRATRVAAEVLRQSNIWDADPLMVTAIISVENPRLVANAISTAGARGIMQIMPLWAESRLRSCGHDLLHDRTNLCYGVRIWRFYVARHDYSHSKALLGYNGCVRTRGCERYATIVWTNYLRFRYIAHHARNRSFVDHVIWNMSERKWLTEYEPWTPFTRNIYTTPFDMMTGRRFTRGAPRVRAASSADAPELVRNRSWLLTSHNPLFQE